MCFWCCLQVRGGLRRGTSASLQLGPPEIFQALIPDRTVKTESRWVEECGWEGLRDDNGMEKGSGGKALERRKY